jgi:RNA ligase (TIGR02306 family)
VTGQFGLDPETPVFLLGEIYGPGIQDLGYGAQNPELRAFDVYLGKPQQGRYLDPEEKAAFLAELGIAQVPVLYEGPWDRATADRLRDGETTLGAGHIREGVVITPMTGRYDDRFGRVILKHVSDAYLTRKGGTEYT